MSEKLVSNQIHSHINNNCTAQWLAGSFPLIHTRPRCPSFTFSLVSLSFLSSFISSFIILPLDKNEFWSPLQAKCRRSIICHFAPAFAVNPKTPRLSLLWQSFSAIFVSNDHKTFIFNLDKKCFFASLFSSLRENPFSLEECWSLCGCWSPQEEYKLASFRKGSGCGLVLDLSCGNWLYWTTNDWLWVVSTRLVLGDYFKRMPVY
jgi:hypothetical protein